MNGIYQSKLQIMVERMASCLSVSQVYDYINELIGRNLLVLNSDQWIHKRPSSIENSPNAFECSLCQEQFNNWSSLDDHKQSAHGGIRQLKCWLCPMRFRRMGYLNNHYKLHHPFASGKVNAEDEKECNDTVLKDDDITARQIISILPAKEFSSERISSNGEKSSQVQDSVNEQGSCSQLETESRPNECTADSVANSVDTFKCDICQKDFVDLFSVRIHKRWAHLGEKPFKCEFCSKRYKKKRFLDKHKNNKGFCRKSYHCYQCDMVFKSKYARQVHVSTVHSGEIDAKCDICKKQFKNMIYLKRHVRRMHTVPR